MSEVKLYLGDCLEILSMLNISQVDAIITDPPYGIEYDPQRYNESTTTNSAFVMVKGDDVEFDPRPWFKFSAIILWGANNYTRYLPRGGWLCWDKRCSERADRMFGSPFELAWIWTEKRPRIFKIARIQHGGVVNADGHGLPRLCPTQKPIKLMRWCIEVLNLPRGSTVLDPYMGSGTMGVACVQAGLNFIGMEIVQEQFEIAQKRIGEAKETQEQLRMDL